MYQFFLVSSETCNKTGLIEAHHACNYRTLPHETHTCLCVISIIYLETMAYITVEDTIAWLDFGLFKEVMENTLFIIKPMR